MTIAYRDGEAWTFDEGAPEGPPIDVTVPSSREGHAPYRIVRDDISGIVIHTPACEAFHHRPRVCRHLRRAFALAEEPEATFVQDVLDSWRDGGRLDTASRAEFASYVVQAALVAKQQRKAIDEYERRKARPPVSHEEAVREFS